MAHDFTPMGLNPHPESQHAVQQEFVKAYLGYRKELLNWKSASTTDTLVGPLRIWTQGSAL